eukprot:NODE_548_length_6182_cov_1.284564.p2 type:complete len:338 gc:universal NODE_548_length_6182_cov_1.284564:5114-4101(-)
MGLDNFRKNLKSRWSKWTFIVSALQVFVMIIAEGYVAIQFYYHTKAFDVTPIELRNIKALEVYHYLFIIAQVFQLLFVMDAVSSTNTISLIAVVIFNMCSFVYSIIQQNQYSALEVVDPSMIDWIDNEKTLYQAVIVLAAIFTLSSAFCCWKMHKELGWKIYKALGADIQLKTMYRWYHLFKLLLQVDIFFYLGFSIQFIVLVLADENSSEQGTLNSQGRLKIILNAIVGFGTAFVLYFFGSVGAKKENRKILNLFFAGTLGTVGYFTWKLTQILDPEQSTRFESVQKSLTYFTCMCLLLALTSMGAGGFVKKNFGHGLKQHLNGNAKITQKRWMVE